MNEYSMMTQELQDLAALSMEHGQIPSGLYDQYHVLRGLRDVNGKGVLAGITGIPESSWKLSYIADELCARRYYESTR